VGPESGRLFQNSVNFGTGSPDYFALYSDQNRYIFASVHAAHYLNLSMKYRKASDCRSCKECEAHCPQHIAISERMKEVAVIFEAPHQQDDWTKHKEI
jgi:predicted aldo/keto reductase-like oxidoreductase